MPRISALTPLPGTQADDLDELPINDASLTTTKKLTLAGVIAWLQTKAAWITSTMIGNSQVKEANLDRVNYSKIVVKQSVGQTLSSAGVDVTFNTTEIVDGTLLTRSGNRVVIGAGVTRVKVTYALMAENNSAASYLYTGIMRNTTRLTMQLSGIFGSFASVSEARIVPVSPGDTIAITADCGGGSIQLNPGRVCYMCVEVIG